MSCVPCSTSTPQECLPPQASLFFFKGTVGPPGPTGAASTVPGPPGATGIAGPVGVYVRNYSAATVYYDNAARNDIVAYAGQIWIVNNAAKNGLSGWGTPTVADWAPFGSSIAFYATNLALVGIQDVTVPIVITNPGYITSADYVPGVTGWVATGNGGLNIYTSSSKFAGQVATNSPKFNLASENRTMPPIAYATYTINAIGDGAIPVNPLINNVTDNALIFFGWLRGANSFLTNRFGNATQVFFLNVTGIGRNESTLNDFFYIQLYYRLRTSGGGWGPWVQTGDDALMQKIAGLDQSFQKSTMLTISLTGDQDIQFSAGFSKGSGGGANASVGGGQLSIQAFN